MFERPWAHFMLSLVLPTIYLWFLFELGATRLPVRPELYATFQNLLLQPSIRPEVHSFREITNFVYQILSEPYGNMKKKKNIFNIKNI